MSVREGQDKTLAEALALSQQLELNLLREGQNVDVVERNSGASVYKLQRPQNPESLWDVQLHLSSRLFHANSGSSEILRFGRDKAKGTLELQAATGLCPSTVMTWEGHSEGVRLAGASSRFLFNWDGQEYAWRSHAKFAGHSFSCQNLTTGNTLACYMSKMWPRKLQGTLVIEPQVQDMALLHTIVAGCLGYRMWMDWRATMVGFYTPVRSL